jgi:hypothetical protein
MQKTKKYSIEEKITEKCINLLYNDIVIDNEIKDLIKIHKNIRVPCNYLYPLDNLPIEIETLYINEYGNYDEFGGYSLNNFNKPLNNLPSGLKCLWIYSYEFNQSLDYLPITLIELAIFSINFDKELNNLPIGLKKLTIDLKYYKKTLNNLPLGLEELNISNTYPYLEDIKKQYPNIKFGIIEW